MKPFLELRKKETESSQEDPSACIALLSDH